jgi:uroporphyrinogen-III synthase
MTGRPPVVVVTRDERSDPGLSRALAALGVQPVPLPTTAIEPAEDAGPLHGALGMLDAFDWVVFTSGHAVEIVCGVPSWPREWPRPAGRPRVAAVGTRTAARLAAHGVHVDLVPEEEASAAGLLRSLERAGGMQGAHVLWPRSDIARSELADGLSRLGARLVAPEAYRTVPVRATTLATFFDELRGERVDAIVFLSPSSASALAAAAPDGTLGCLQDRVLVGSIGPTTSARLTELGAPADVQPAAPSARAMAEAIVGALGQRGGRR